MTSENKIKENENFLCGLELPEHNVNLYLTYIGSDKVHYDMFWKDKLLFSGSDFRPSPLYSGHDSLECIVGCLDFFVLQQGDVEKDFFKNYTKEQMNWRESKDCEELKILTLDFTSDDECREDFTQSAKEFFQSHYIIQPLKYNIL